jgi:hypothetical protein
MDLLASTLGLNFTFVPAVTKEDQKIGKILERVRVERIMEGWCVGEEGGRSCTDSSSAQKRMLIGDSRHPSNERPMYAEHPRPLLSDIISIARSMAWTPESTFLPDAYALQADPTSIPLAHAGSDLWTLDSSLAHSSNATAALPGDPITGPPAPIPIIHGATMQAVLAAKHAGRFTSYSEFNKRNAFNSSRPNGTASAQARGENEKGNWWTVLSEGMVACWHSHITALRTFVESGEPSALILEDDVDMEVSVYFPIL